MAYYLVILTTPLCRRIPVLFIPSVPRDKRFRGQNKKEQSYINFGSEDSNGGLIFLPSDMTLLARGTMPLDYLVNCFLIYPVSPNHLRQPRYFMSMCLPVIVENFNSSFIRLSCELLTRLHSFDYPVIYLLVYPIFICMCFHVFVRNYNSSLTVRNHPIMIYHYIPLYHWIN